MARKYIDCRDTPSERNCTLRMSGEEDELLEAATQHMVSMHSHQDSPELREQIKTSWREDLDDRYERAWAPDLSTGPMAP